MQTERDKAIEDYFRDSTTPLSSNFNWLVMQRVYESKLKQARRHAIFESALVALATLITGIMLLAGYFAWSTQESWPLPQVPNLLIPAASALFLLILIDSMPSILRR